MATLLVQVLIAGRLMKRLGVHVVLTLLPATVALGFIGLAIVGSLAALSWFALLLWTWLQHAARASHNTRLVTEIRR